MLTGGSQAWVPPASPDILSLPAPSLHNEGRAVKITVSDKKRLGQLAALAYVSPCLWQNGIQHFIGIMLLVPSQTTDPSARAMQVFCLRECYSVHSKLLHLMGAKAAKLLCVIRLRQLPLRRTRPITHAMPMPPVSSHHRALYGAPSSDGVHAL